MNTILGIDPGSQVTGYGIIRSDGQTHSYVASGSIIVRGQDFPSRLAQIFNAIHQIIAQHLPQEAAIEQVFMARNANSALKLGQARGAAIVALAKHPLLISEYSPRSIKQAIVGYGDASKQQIQHMTRILLNLTKVPPTDAADALAVAICHAQTRTCIRMTQLAGEIM